jgi:precorrin-2 dehydrogenase/sirohydrochlorin ferrochelatase
MQYFPLFVNLKNKPVLVVGGGEVACRKIESLIKAGAVVTIVAPNLCSELERNIDEWHCQWIKAFYSADRIDGHIQVWATTDNPDLNHRVCEDARAKGVLVNVVDDTPYCDFITPSIVNRGRIQIAISSGGASPIIVRNIRKKLESVLPQNLALQAEFAASKRNDLKSRFKSVDERKYFWERFFDRELVNSAQSSQDLESVYQQCLSDSTTVASSVHWIEFGSDFELLPIKALRIMQEAELTIYPRTCPYVFVDSCRRDSERLEVNDIKEIVQTVENNIEGFKKIVVFIPTQLSQIDPNLKLKIADKPIIKLATE